MSNGIRVSGLMICFSIVSTTFATSRAAVDETITRVPLGGTLSARSGEHRYAVYVPTRFGGVLTIKTTDGEVTKLTGPDGKLRMNGEEVGDNQQGWYTFQISGSKKSYSIDTTFVQIGRSVRAPWNFYYWPTKSDSIHEPWAGWNGRVDTMQVMGDDVMVRTPGGPVGPGQDIVLAGPNGLLETPVGRGDDSTWFPNLSDDLTFRGADGTLYATPAPLLKYDQIYNTSARAWEAANTQNTNITRWPGHCLGGAVASIMLNEPIPAPGSGLTRDELKALWAELGENHLNHRIGDYANEIPPGPPAPGYDMTDSHAPRVHAMFEKHIRGQKQNLLGNLRAFPPRGTPDEVWNQGIGRFTAKYHAVPGKSELVTRLEVELAANSGSCINGQDDKPRLVEYEYIIPYNLKGEVDETRSIDADWIRVGGEAMYAPLNILEVLQTTWAGHNPMVTEANVRALDLANGGSGTGPGRWRLASAPPNFRSVAEYEAGRPYFGGRRVGMFGADPEGPPRRGGLFRLFGGGR